MIKLDRLTLTIDTDSIKFFAIGDWGKPGVVQKKFLFRNSYFFYFLISYRNYSESSS